MGGNYYRNQPSSVAFNSTVLTAAFAGNQHIVDVGGFQKLSIDLDYAMGGAEAGNTVEFQIEHSPDNGLNWYVLIIDETAIVSTLTDRMWQMAPGKRNVIVDIAYKKLRISMKETGVAVNFGTATMKYTLSGL